LQFLAFVRSLTTDRYLFGAANNAPRKRHHAVPIIHHSYCIHPAAMTF
jgi:hypothetical protein